MEKYYAVGYDRRLGGDYCEIYDENGKRVRTEKGATSVPGLVEVLKKSDPVKAFYITRELTPELLEIVEPIKMTEEQRDKFTRNIVGGKR